MGGAVGVAVTFSGSLFGPAQTPSSPTPSVSVADPAPAPPQPEVAPVPRPAARNPFAEPVPGELASIQAQIVSGHRPSRRALAVVSRYQRDHAADPRPGLMLAHTYVDRRWLSFALPEYQHAYQLDATVRGDPEMLTDLLEMVRANDASIHRPAADLVVEAYGPEASAAIADALAGRARPDERQRLEALQSRIAAAQP